MQLSWRRLFCCGSHSVCVGRLESVHAVLFATCKQPLIGCTCIACNQSDIAVGGTLSRIIESYRLKPFLMLLSSFSREAHTRGAFRTPFHLQEVLYLVLMRRHQHHQHATFSLGILQTTCSMHTHRQTLCTRKQAGSSPVSVQVNRLRYMSSGAQLLQVTTIERGGGVGATATSLWLIQL